MAENKADAVTKGPEAVKAGTEDKTVQLQAEVDRLTKALASKLGVDATLAELYENQERELVQFKRGYAFAGRYSDIDNSKAIVDAYQGSIGDIGLMPVSEIARLKEIEEQTGVKTITDDPKEFTDKDVFVRQWDAKAGESKLVKIETVSVAKQKKAGQLFG